MQDPTSSTLPAMVAIIVLYKRAAEESESLTTLLAALHANAALASNFSLILYDNSEQPRPPALAAPCPLEYVHDGQNSGLATAYNYALSAARRTHAAWLLLLDQDTSLSIDYLRELRELSLTHVGRTEVGAIVPKLIANEIIYSPEANFLYQMRHQLRTVRHPIEPDVVGVQPSRISAYNSGAAIRVTALEAIGGFPQEYWLDYLDHAVFHALDKRGYLLCVMHASLEQRLSHMDVNEVPHWRHRNVLTAQTRFVVENGTFLERTMYRLYLLRTCRFLHRKCRNRAVWKEMLLQVFLLRVPSPRVGK
jgi:GT2 family glycosyltransferase